MHVLYVIIMIVYIFILCAAAPILLDDIDCGLADRFEDCIHRGWGVHNCGSYASVGVVCNPGPSG